MNKRKIFNDPVYGFISLPYEIIYDLIEHPYFQRLRRIRQLGLTSMVYPGAYHTRFSHAIGAMHLVVQAVSVLRDKGVEISDEESKAVAIAILLHDIGHGPFSHALENSIVKGMHHEDVSILFMNRLNEEFSGELTLAISIFKDEYDKKFLHQLVSSQLDADRLDYLSRDSFYTGVSEGVVGVDRIIKMLNVSNGELVVDYKGIYSIEKFLIARRIMYWQVYLHKTVISAEFLLIKVLQRAKELASKGVDLFCTPSLRKFLYSDFTHTDFANDDELLNDFARLDDYDILTCSKVWQQSDDFILAELCAGIVDRKLFKVKLQSSPIDRGFIEDINKKIKESVSISDEEMSYFAFGNHIETQVYESENDPIFMLSKNGSLTELSCASEQFNLVNLSKPEKKYFYCYKKI